MTLRKFILFEIILESLVISFLGIKISLLSSTHDEVLGTNSMDAFVTNGILQKWQSREF